MNKKIIAALLALTTLAVSVGAVTAGDDISVFVDNKRVEFKDASPFIDNDYTLVPFRAIFEALGAQVCWEEETRTVVSYDPVTDISVTLQIDADVMFVKETPVRLEVPAKIVNDRTVVPVRAISEGLNRVVDWDGKTRTVTIK